MKTVSEPTTARVGPATLELGNQPSRVTAIHALHSSDGSSTRQWSRHVPTLVLGLVVFCLVQAAGATDYYQTDNESSTPELNYYLQERHQRTAAEQQEKFRKRVSIRHAVGDDVLARYLRQQQASLPTPTVPPPPISDRALLITVFSFIVAILTVRKLAPELFVALNKRFNPWAQTAATVAGLSAKVRAEDAAFSAFVTAFRTGPAAASGPGSTDAVAVADRGLLMEFFAKTPKTLAALQKAVQEITQAEEGVARQGLLASLHRELHALKGGAGLHELLPVWQMASALEGLVKQLSSKAGDVNLSTLRTVAAGVDLLKDLCAPGLPADLLTNPPIRLLAVDDDLISRNAVTLALKKAFETPDLAETGEAALALAMDHAYDVIFLDVQMPGMDGFETCTRIHGTAPNGSSPIVFVTCQSDFEARAKSTLCGGTDLIGKPFLSFEITVKALTLALQGRLSKRAQLSKAPEASGMASASADVSPAPNQLSKLPDNSTSSGAPVSASVALPVTSQRSDPDPLRPQPRFTLPENMTSADTTAPTKELSPEELLQAFLTRAANNFGPLRDLIQTLFRVTDEQVRQEMLSDFFLRFNALAPQSAATAGEHPALRLCLALEGLLTKMLSNPSHSTSSTLLTVATAVDLLLELCDPEVRPDLVTSPPIHMLVVDDDPVARRAVTGALQMSFEKPDNVDSGEAALHLAEKKAYDAIFLDVEMPGMDGFATCLKIHHTQLNRNTPVVFVTCHSDFKARSQSAVSGGSDLIAKPFLPAEIKVKALTFAMHGRLQKEKSARHLPAPSPEEKPVEAELVPA